MSTAAALSWRRVCMADAPLLWSWANDPETRRNSFTKGPIPYGEHVAWLEERLRSGTTYFWIFTDGVTPVGQVRCEVDGPTAEVHISVAPSSRGRGLGKAMLPQVLHLLREACGSRVRVRASVLENNVQSRRLFEACGFQQVGALERPARERAIVFEWMASSPAGVLGVSDPS